MAQKLTKVYEYLKDNTKLIKGYRVHLAKTKVKDVVGWDDENGAKEIEVNIKYEPNRIIIERKQT